MVDIVLFHSVLGVRQGVTDAADRLRAAGHTVRLPNLYADGVAFDDYAKAMEYVESIGSFPELLRRTQAAVERLPSDVVYAGFSNGGAAAEYLAAARPGARGALLFSAAIPLDMLLNSFGDEPRSWPSDVPVQVHYATNDPFRQGEEDWVAHLGQSVRASGAAFEFHEYEGAGHLFTDASLPNEYNAEAADQLWRRVIDYLAKLSA